MLTHLGIQDFAIIDAVELSLREGMTVLTGETGAGKSILLDALSLVLGGRADSTTVRQGADRADITARFDLPDDAPASAWLRDNELDADGECILRRVVGADGRSKGYINGRPAPVQTLRELGESLVDLHGQHEHQSLLKARVQRELLDAFGAHDKQLEETAGCYRQWQATADELEALRSSARNRDQRLDLMQYQAVELEAANPEAGEFETLQSRHALLANARHIDTTLQEVLFELHESEAAINDRLARLQHNVEEIRDHDPQLASLVELLDNAGIQLGEAVGELRAARERVDLDPESLQRVEQRLQALHDIARKHHVEPEELPALAERLRNELDTAEQASQKLEAAQARSDEELTRYREAAGRLHKVRKKSAVKLSSEVTAVMQTLGMAGGALQVRVTHDPEAKPGVAGNDSVAFDVAANAGQSPRPLGKVASGGELSRISLAIELIVADGAEIPTRIFDEVDAGIGGAVAEIVGAKLAALGEHCQALCVTHLPQVAAQAHHHMQVSKMTGDRTTRTRVRELTGQERVDEVARMLGGIDVTPQSLAHAESMIRNAGSS